MKKDFYIGQQIKVPKRNRAYYDSKPEYQRVGMNDYMYAFMCGKTLEIIGLNLDEDIPMVEVHCPEKDISYYFHPDWLKEDPLEILTKQELRRIKSLNHEL